MKFKDYIAAVVADIRDAILGGDYDEYVDATEDVTESDVDAALGALMDDDGVTGNGSGSYTFNAAKAADNIGGLATDPEFSQIVDGLWYRVGPMFADGPESVDVLARCLALGESRDEVKAALLERREHILGGGSAA